MPLILIVTLVYLAVLVAVLAVGLSVVAWRLIAAAKAIRQVRDALARVQGDTRPLGETLEKINGALAAVAAGLGSVKGHLFRADGALGRIARRFRSTAA